ncbi:hypothetical protein GGI12_003231 [Dipsacomyces acuminosporus]|nr:hypothetical protein GGI12_003231 [Dipsacomyces acuminosporus]
MKSDRRIYDGGFIYLRSWYNYKSDDVKNKCIIAAVHMIYGLIQLNKSTEYADLLVQSDELRQAALDLSTLVSGVVENLDSSSNNNNSVDEEQDLMTAIHDKDYFTGLFYAIRIMRLLWITRKENTTEHSMSSYPVHRLLFLICWRKDQQIDPAEVRSIIDCLDCWARVTVDIHLQLQLSAWKANATQSEGADELDKDYCNLVTDLWRKVLEAAWEGAEEQQQYLDEDTTLENTRTKPTPIIQHTYLYIQNNQPTPFSALQAAKAAIDDELSGGE